MEIKNMTMSEIEARMAEIRNEMESDGADLDALTEEVRGLKARRAELESAAEKRTQILDEVNKAPAARTFKEPERAEERFTAASPEFASAWWKELATDARGKKMFGDLTDVEKRAFTFVTTNTPEVVPTEVMDRIVELIDNDSPMYDDSQKSNMRFGFSLPRHKSITAGDAKNVTEGVANDDEQDTFDSLDLPGVEIKKHIVMSRKMEFQSIDAFKEWVLTHLAARIRVAKEKYLISQLGQTATGIETGNVLTAAALTDAELRKCLALLRGSGKRVLYANSDFIWNTLAGLEDEGGDKLFIPSAMNDPIVEGRVYGTIVKRDSNIPDDTFYIGYPNKILSNEFILFDITPQIEDKTLNKIFVGYSLFDGGLEDPKAFVKWSVQVG